MAETKKSRTVCGYNILSVAIALLSVISLDALLFASLHYKNRYRLYRIQGLVIIQLLLFFTTRYLWRSLHNLCGERSLPEKSWKLILAGFFFLAHSGPCFTFVNTRDPYTLGLAAWVFFGTELTLLGFFWLFGVMIWVLECFNFGHSGVASFCRSKAKGWVCFILTMLYISAAHHNATSPPIVVRQNIPIAKLPTSMDGLKIVLLSDIHLGPTVGFELMDHAVKITNSLKPDIVVLAGDLTDGTVAELREAALPLKNIVAPYGSFFVTGNHEYYTSDVENWMEFLESMGFHVLHNSNVKIHATDNPSEWFCIFGTDDAQSELFYYSGHSVDLKKAFDGCDAEHSAVLITHQPNVVKKALKMDLPIQLALSGHTHGGQFFPFAIPVYLTNAFFTGLYKYDLDTYVYVSQGTYYYGWPLRMGSHNEISEIILKSA